MASLICSGSLLPLLPALADQNSPKPGELIENQATATFTDAADDTPGSTVSDKVQVTVAEVAGISATNVGITNSVYRTNIVYFDFLVKNEGNDPTQLFVPAQPSSATIAGVALPPASIGQLQVIEYNNVTTTTSVTTGNLVNTTTGSTTGSLTGIPNNGSVPAGGYIKVRVPITVPFGAVVGDTISVTLGNTVGQPGYIAPATNPYNSNMSYVAGGNDLYTQDNSGTANNDFTGDPINGDTTDHRVEASATQTTTVVAPPNITITGTAWDDANGSAIVNGVPGFTGIQNSPEAGANVTPAIYAILVDANGNVLTSAPVGTNGTYTLTTPAAQNGLYVILSTSAGTVGIAAPATGLPPAWTNTSPLTRVTLPLNVGIADVTGQDFGIDRLPDTLPVNTSSQANPPGATKYQVPTLKGTDPEDGVANPTTPITRFKIIDLPLATQGILYYNGVAVIAGDILGTTAVPYDPTKLTFDPVDGVVNMSFTYASVDAAGKVDASPAIASMSFSATPVGISGTVWNDFNNSANNTFTNIPTAGEVGTDAVFGTTTTPVNAVLVDTTTGLVIGSTVVSNTGIYSFPSVPANTNVKVILSSTAGTINSQPPTAATPAGWVRTSPVDSGVFNTGLYSSPNKDFGIRQKAKLVLVKRITKINGATTNPNDGTVLTGATATDTFNNVGNWPPNYLVGKTDAGSVKPNDTIEYTVYFLNNQGADATNVKICDPIRGSQEFVPGSIKLQPGGAGTDISLTDAPDTADRASSYLAGNTPSGCNAAASTASGIDKGGVAIDITGPATTNQPAMTAVSGATGVGAPNASYGLFRFTTKVKPQVSSLDVAGTLYWVPAFNPSTSLPRQVSMSVSKSFHRHAVRSIAAAILCSPLLLASGAQAAPVPKDWCGRLWGITYPVDGNGTVVLSGNNKIIWDNPLTGVSNTASPTNVDTIPSLPTSTSGGYATLGIHANSGTLYTLDRNNNNGSYTLYQYSMSNPAGWTPKTLSLTSGLNYNKMAVNGDKLIIVSSDSLTSYTYSISSTGAISGGALSTYSFVTNGTPLPNGNPGTPPGTTGIGSGDIAQDEYGDLYNVVYDSTGLTQYAYFYKLVGNQWIFKSRIKKNIASDQYTGFAFYNDTVYVKGSAGQLFNLSLTRTGNEYSWTPTGTSFSAPLGGTQTGIGDLATCGIPSVGITKTQQIFTDATGSTLTTDQTRIATGQYIKYTIVLANGGDAWARSTKLTDALPAGVTYVPDSATVNDGVTTTTITGNTYPFVSPVVATSGGAPNLGTIRLPVGTVSSTVTYTYRVKVISTAAKIENKATVSYTGYNGSFPSIAPSCPAVSPTATANATDVAVHCGVAVAVPYPSIYGTVWNDTNGSAGSTFNNIFSTGEAGTNTGTENALYALLLGSTGNVISSQPVGSDGKYSFLEVIPALSTLKIQLSTTAAGAASVPTGWKATSPKIKPTVNAVNNISSTNNDFGISQPAGTILVKRITAINGQTTNPNDKTTVLTNVLNNPATPNDDPATPNDNAARKWPTGYLKGAYDTATAGKVRPGDTIEYTVYYLNNSGADTKNLKICDPIRGRQKYVPGSMKLQPGSAATATVLTDAVDPTVDRANAYGAAVPTGLPAVTEPTCDNSISNPLYTIPSDAKSNGGVAIQITGTGASAQPTLDAIPAATAAGTPSSSYGSFRFTTKVDP